MSEYWKSFWDKHTDELSSNDPFKQVERTLNQKSPSKNDFDKVLQYNTSMLDLKLNHEVLDFCCGNGLFSTELAQYCKRVTGVDFCQNLILELKNKKYDNIISIQSDALEITFEHESFDRVLFSAALQHFTESEVIKLFHRIYNWLKPNGLLFITDILDQRKIWEFYNSQDRIKTYFTDLEKNTPIMGTWFDRTWVEQLGIYTGFKDSKSISQPNDFWYSHYRFDFICRK
jgi:cyclopropane fatty-acyl-phospholipid synthase-like methyltransferase